jgi:hypothetical protein
MTVGKGTSLLIKVVVIRSIGIQETPVAMTIIREESTQDGRDPPPPHHLLTEIEIVIAERVSTTGFLPHERIILHLAPRCQLGG